MSGKEVPASAAIAAELAAARLAREQGNEGMVRVCARRAAGAAIAAWREERQLPRTRDAISLLRSLAGDPEIPPPIREAAHRLTTRVRSDFTPAHAEDPIDDARNIAAYCAGVAPEG